MALSQFSRYKFTGEYDDGEGAGPLYGPWMVPQALDYKSKSSGVTHVVSSADVGFLDRIAVRYYGEGTEPLWWVVCRANGVIDPEIDITPGTRLYIPSLARVNQYLKS